MDGSRIDVTNTSERNRGKRVICDSNVDGSRMDVTNTSERSHGKRFVCDNNKDGSRMDVTDTSEGSSGKEVHERGTVTDSMERSRVVNTAVKGSGTSTLGRGYDNTEDDWCNYREQWTNDG